MTLPLFGLGQQGKSPIVTAQRHLNLYAEITQEAEKGSIAFYGTPGLTLFTSFGDTPVRGAIAVGDFMYMVHRGTLWQVNNAGVKTFLGALNTTSGRVDMAHNGPQIGIVDGANMYCLTIATNAFAVVSSGLFANPSSITFQNGYFICSFKNSGQFQHSAAYDGTTWGALDFFTAETNPDNVVRIFSDHGELTPFGDVTSEFWGASGGDAAFANQPGAAQEFGLAAAWSLTKYNDSLAGVFKNKMGQVQVMMMIGHAFTPLSSQEHSFIINNYPAVSDATAFAYLLGGHPMLQVNFPTAGKSWLYDHSTKLWSPLESGLNGGRHLAEICIDYLNKPRVTDYANGNVYTLDTNAYTDNGAPILRELVSRRVHQGGKRFSMASLQIVAETGVGVVSGQGSDPQAMLQVSKDGGKTWGAERWASIGSIGNYLTRLIWRRFGAAYDFIFRIRISDPVKVVLRDEAYEGGMQ